MDSEIVDIIGEQIQSDGIGSKQLRKDQMLAQVVTELHGKYREATFRNRCFIISTPAAGVTVPIYSNATQQFVIYNPWGSGVNVSLLKAWVGYVSGTMVAGHMCYAASINQAAPSGTTNANIQNAKISVPDVSKGGSGVKANYFSPCNPAVAFSTLNYLRPMGNSQVVQAATATNAPWTQYDDIDGSIELVASGSIFVIAANVAAAVVATIAVLVEEIPVR